MNKAFIFDMDGVIVNSESVWLDAEREFFTPLLGEEAFCGLKINFSGHQ